jgi:hypothetical protein
MELYCLQENGIGNHYVIWNKPDWEKVSYVRSHMQNVDLKKVGHEYKNGETA